jgi:glutathione synthase
MEIAFIIDPIASLKAYKDTSVSMMRALQTRGAKLFVLEPADLFWTASSTQARTRPLTVTDDDHDWHRTGESLIRPLTSFDAVMMRKDPPFDMEYVYSTYLLGAAESEVRWFSIGRARCAITMKRWTSPAFPSSRCRRSSPGTLRC